ncbi:MAG: helix-turn-helix transcriptional regulator [Chthoniobacterales bacterium]|nr:helix-turn-helix transcriptional regulator [Chthoniobacterales bacterium]
MSFQTKRKIIRDRRRSSDASRRSLSERLYDWRKKNDLSQSEAALKLKISKRTLQEWEHGRSEPRHLAMEAVGAVIGC